MNKGREVPEWAMLFFARDESASPRDFVKQRLNDIGDGGGLEMIEMYLLGLTLDCTLQVVRIKSVQDSDFIVDYPPPADADSKAAADDRTAPARCCCVLVAEDDRHYNVLRFPMGSQSGAPCSVCSGRTTIV